MRLDALIATLATFEDALVWTADAASGAPEIAWGDSFLYVSPDGSIPATQPHVTVVTKDYPGFDERSALGDGRWRVNIQVGRERVAELTGVDPGDADAVAAADVSVADRLLPHPLYAPQGFVCVVLPASATADTVIALAREAHAAAQARAARRGRA